MLLIIITVFRLKDSEQNSSNTTHKEQAVSFIRQYIEEHYREKISVSTLAELVYLNPDYLGRIFRKSTGMTVGEMIQNKRIEKACYFLSDTKKTIADIALMCGFEDSKFFNNVFSKHMGITPSRYRQQILKKPAR